MAKLDIKVSEECLNHAACSIFFDDDLHIIAWGRFIAEQIPTLQAQQPLNRYFDVIEPDCGFDLDHWRRYQGERFTLYQQDSSQYFWAYPIAFEPHDWVLVLTPKENEEGEYKPSNTEVVPQECQEIQGQMQQYQLQNELLRKEILRAQQQMMESERMAMCGEMVAGFTHDLKTPLGVAIGAMSVFKEANKGLNQAVTEGKLGKSVLIQLMETFNETQDILEKNLNRSLHLLENLKQMSWDQFHDELRLLELPKYTDELLETLHSLYRKRQIRVEVDYDAPTAVQTYPGSYSRIISNLVINAVNHAFEADASDKVIHLRVSGQDEMIHILLSDNGKGIPAEVLEHIFEPYFTTAAHEGGTGLGLHIVRHLVEERLGGCVRCLSTLGQGTTFDVSFPFKS